LTPGIAGRPFPVTSDAIDGKAPLTPTAKLVVGIIAQGPELLSEAEAAVEQEFGSITRRSDVLPFDLTDYYEPEMGRGLVRRWVGLKGVVAVDRLPGLKLQSIRLEARFSVRGRRRVNLDPGLLSLHNFVLATTKDFAHRIFLHDGIRAEVTLIYQSGLFRPLEWTYADYRSETCHRFLADCRRDLVADSRSQEPGDSGP